MGQHQYKALLISECETSGAGNIAAHCATDFGPPRESIEEAKADLNDLCRKREETAKTLMYSSVSIIGSHVVVC